MLTYLFRRNRPTITDLSKALVSAHDRVVQRMLQARRSGNQSVWNGLCDVVTDEDGHSIGSWSLRQIIVQSARTESLRLFDAECKAYADRIAALAIRNVGRTDADEETLDTDAA